VAPVFFATSGSCHLFIIPPNPLQSPPPLPFSFISFPSLLLYIILCTATWNANGLLNHKQEVITFLHLKKIDALLISESHFTDLTAFNIPQYIIYSTPHPDGTAHGGSLIIIRKSIPRNELPKYQTDKIQATTVEIKITTWQFTVTAIYSPPRHNISTEDYKDFFQSLGTHFIVGSEWNAKHTMGLESYHYKRPKSPKNDDQQ
jgi:hypothetical protein